MSALVPDVFDPDKILAGVFGNPAFAEDLAFGFTCTEVNVLVGHLAHHGEHHGAAAWMRHHLDSCPDRPRHLH